MDVAFLSISIIIAALVLGEVTSLVLSGEHIFGWFQKKKASSDEAAEHIVYEESLISQITPQESDEEEEDEYVGSGTRISK